MMTSQCQVKASAHTVAIHGRVHGSRKALDFPHQTLPSLCEVVGCGRAESRDFVQIRAGREALAIAADD